MTTILDQTDDLNGQQLYKLLQTNEVPDFVKDASSNDIYGTDLPTHVFADPTYRKFPCHTAAATWVSTVSFLDNKSSIPLKTAGLIEERLKVSANKFAIESPLASSKKAADTRRLDSRGCTDNVPSEHNYPIRNEKELQAAVLYLEKYSSEIPFSIRHNIARRASTKAAVLNYDLGNKLDFIEKQAGLGSCTAKDAAGLLWNRINAIGRIDKPNETQIQLGKMAVLCDESNLGNLDNELLVKLANIIDSVDRSYGLHKEYSEDLPAPEDVLFTITTKSASALIDLHCPLISGSIYKKSDFSKLDLEAVRDLMGNDFADSVSNAGFSISPEKFAEVAQTLPRPDAALLESLFTEAGIGAVYKEAAYVESGLSLNDWAELSNERVELEE